MDRVRVPDPRARNHRSKGHPPSPFGEPGLRASCVVLEQPQTLNGAHLDGAASQCLTEACVPLVPEGVQQSCIACLQYSNHQASQ